jgi:putative transposase
MAAYLPNFPRGDSHSFQKIVDAFLAGESLPFADVLSAERIERIFQKHSCLFGLHGVYTTAIMVWSFLSQVLRDGKEASCQAAVARVVSYCQIQGLQTPTEDTGDYCRARAKLSSAALRDLSCEVAEELEQAAKRKWLWKGKFYAKLVDGFTFTMPDTPKNQGKYPQQKAQKPGIGLPIARAAAIVSMATACVMDLAIAPYQGKETGESALLRSMLGSLYRGDIAVMDRYYCSFMLIALLLGQGTQTCARKHHLRHGDFRRGQRLGKYDHMIVWARPQRPTWMDEETYRKIPEKLVLREIRYNITEPGRRTKSIDIITTLIDADEYSKEDIAELYGFRWNSELDIRSIKSNLNLGHVRCKSPAMVLSEVWTTILAYNLIRITAAGAALLHHKQPRQISFTSTCQYVLASWMLLSGRHFSFASLDDFQLTMLEQIACCEVANRPGRLEPRVLKRRRHGYKLMMKPRNELRRELRKHCT